MQVLVALAGQRAPAVEREDLFRLPLQDVGDGRELARVVPDQIEKGILVDQVRQPRRSGLLVGFEAGLVSLGFDQLVLYVSASAYEAGLYRKADPAELERYFAGAHAFYSSLPPDRYPVLASVAPDMTGADADDRFEFGLNVLIAGFEAASAAEAADQPPE